MTEEDLRRRLVGLEDRMMAIMIQLAKLDEKLTALGDLQARVKTIENEISRIDKAVGVVHVIKWGAMTVLASGLTVTGAILATRFFGGVS